MIIKIAVSCNAIILMIISIIEIIAENSIMNALNSQFSADSLSMYGISEATLNLSTIFLLVFYLVFYGSALFTIKCMEDEVKNGSTKRKVSLITIIYCFLIAALTISSIFSGGILMKLSSLGMLAAYTLIAVCLIKLRIDMENAAPK